MTRTTLNCCPGYGCGSGCILRTHVENGKIVKVEKLTYPNGEMGDICLRGMATTRLPYHADRLKYPLKRIGARGEGKWQRITWEQALDEIAAKLLKVRTEFKPESVLMLTAGSSAPPSETQIMIGDRLRNLLGATDMWQGLGLDSGTPFSGYFSYGTSYAQMIDPRAVIEGNSKYLIAWGCNPAEMNHRFWRLIRAAQKKGAKLVDIGLRMDPTAKAADWFIPVQAGSDGALALSMIDIIVRGILYDADFVVQNTNGPFLVRIDNGKLLREADIFPGSESQNYVVWDMVTNQAKFIPPHSACPEDIRPALFGTYSPGDIESKPVFQLLAELAAEYPTHKASDISGVPVESIEKLTREYASTKPAAIIVCYGLRYANSGNAYRAINVLSAITGNIGVMGGGTLYGYSAGQMNAPLLKLNDEVLKNPTKTKTSPIPMTQMFEAITAGKPYPIKACILYGSNFLHTLPNRRRWIEEILPGLDLFVVSDLFMTFTAENADYVLPDCTFFERDDIDIGLDGHVLWLDKAIEPMHECRPPIYLWSELGKRMGFGEYFDKTVEDWVQVRLDSKDPSIAGIDPPLTLQRLKKEKIVRANLPAGIFNPWSAKSFPTPSGRFELYNEELLPAGDALPVFREQSEGPRSPLARKYPLVFLTANNKYFQHSRFSNEPSILDRYMKEPHLSINPDDARQRGIVNGNVVEVYNDRGSLRVKALTDESVPTGVVSIPHGWWPSQYIEGFHNDLLRPLPSLDDRDKAREIYWELACERAKLGIGLPHETVVAYSLDTFSECLCEVKKV